MMFQLSGRCAATVMSSITCSVSASHRPTPGRNSSEVPSNSPHTAASVDELARRWRTATGPAGRRRRCGSSTTWRRTRGRRPPARRAAGRPSRSTSSVGGRPLGGGSAHDDPAQGGVPDHEPGVERERAVEPVEVLGGAGPVPGHALLERLERHALDPGEHAHEVVGRAAGQRGDGEAAVAAEHGGDAVQRRRAERRVPEALHVEVGVHVDEARRDDPAVGVDGPRRGGRRRCRWRRCARRRRRRRPCAASAPVPSTTWPPRITRSCMVTPRADAEVAVEAVAADGVAAHERVGLVVVEPGGRHDLLDGLARVRPGRVAVRVVGLDHDLAHADLVPHGEAGLVVEDAAEHPPRHVAARRVRHPVAARRRRPGRAPRRCRGARARRASTRPGPRDRAMRSVREALEHAAAQPVDEGVGRPLERQGDGDEAGGVGARLREGRRRADVHVDDRVGRLARRPQRVPVVGVHAGQARARRAPR